MYASWSGLYQLEKKDFYFIIILVLSCSNEGKWTMVYLLAIDEIN